MASKRQLWQEFWRDINEIWREFNPSPQTTFKKIFKQRGILKRYFELCDMDSRMTTSILGACRINGDRTGYPVKYISNGKIIHVWKMLSTMTGPDLKQVRKNYRRQTRDLAAQHNRVTKRIEKQVGQRLSQLPLGLFDDDPQALTN